MTGPSEGRITKTSRKTLPPSEEKEAPQDSHPGYWSRRIAKVRSQAPKAESHILDGVCVYFTGIKRGAQYELGRQVWRHGGQVLPMPARRKVTHVIAENLAASKIEKELRAKERDRLLIVTPQWIKDSIRQNKKLPTFDYLLVKNTQTRGMDRYFNKIPRKPTAPQPSTIATNAITRSSSPVRTSIARKHS